MKKWLSLLLTISIVFILVACGNTSEDSDLQEERVSDTNQSETANNKASDPALVEDDYGNTVKLEEPLDSIISLSPSNTEILYALGLGDKVTGVTSYCNYPKEAQNNTIVSDSVTVNVEEVLALDPDLVVAYSIGDKEQLAPVKEAGIPVFGIESATSINDVYEDIEQIAKVTGTQEEAEKVINDMKDKHHKIVEKAKTIEEKKKVYFEISPAPDLWTAGEGSFQGELLEVSGADNVFADVDGWSAIQEEEVIQRAPEVILTSVQYEENTVEKIKERDSWSEIPAIENDEVYLLQEDIVSRPGPRIIDGLEEVFHTIYPEKAD